MAKKQNDVIMRTPIKTFFQIMPTVGAISIALLTFFSGIVFYNTFFYDQTSMPLDRRHVNITAFNDENIQKTVVVLNCAPLVKDTFKVEINRYVECNQITYELNKSVVNLTRNTEPFSSYHVLPRKLPEGTHCTLHINSEWTPALSLKSHKTPERIIPFVVPQGSFDQSR